MNRITRTLSSGEVKTYEYPPPEYLDAAAKCGRSLRYQALVQISAHRWRSGARGKTYNSKTVAEIIRRGEAFLDGDVVRKAA